MDAGTGLPFGNQYSPELREYSSPENVRCMAGGTRIVRGLDEEGRPNVTITARAARTRLRRWGRKSGASERGFTVLELVVIIAMIGVVLGVGIPSLINYVDSSTDSTAQANLKSALVAANSFYLEQRSYTGLCLNHNCSAGSSGGFAQFDTGLNAIPGTQQPKGPQDISIWSVADGTEVILTSYANGTNNCWGIVQSRGSNQVLGEVAPVVVFFVEQGKDGKLPECRAGSPIFRTAFSALTAAQRGTFPPAP